MRKNNKMDMTIVEQLNVVKKKICDNYCKYPAQMLKDYGETEGVDRLMYKCAFCPLKELGV